MAQVSTFYSYKGGSGRSMALANVAWALATNGESVLVIDWDLEAPGLHRYFHPFLSDPDQVAVTGLLDRVWDYIEQFSLGNSASAMPDLANCEDIVQPLELPPMETGKRGRLDLLGAGRQDDDYSLKLGGLDWATFYERFQGEAFIDRMITWARRKYTHILIDSRTGVADTAGICTTQLPDALILCLVYNRQSIEGSAAVATSIVRQRQGRGGKPLKIHVVPSRVEERGVVEAARRHTANKLAVALDQPRRSLMQTLRRDEIRHYPWCAFEEKLAVFEDVPDERGSLLDLMHELARRLSTRDDLAIARIPSEVLESIWRRAAFDDPRMADLEALSGEGADIMRRKLLSWLEEASEQSGERADWLMAIAEAAVRVADGDEKAEASSLRERLGAGAQQAARRAYEYDQGQYRVRYGLLLQIRSRQLQSLRLLDDAVHAASISTDLFSHSVDPTDMWRLARSYELLSEIFILQAREVAAMEALEQAVSVYRNMPSRNKIIGSEIDAARVLSTFARRLSTTDPTAARRLINEVMAKLLRGDRFAFKRREAEYANILVNVAEVAVKAEPDPTGMLDMLHRRSRDFIESKAVLDTLDFRLGQIEARAKADRGFGAEAIEMIEIMLSSANEQSDRTELVGTAVDILIKAGATDEAVEWASRGFLDNAGQLTRAQFTVYSKAMEAAGRREEIMQSVLALVLKNATEKTPPIDLDMLFDVMRKASVASETRRALNDNAHEKP